MEITAVGFQTPLLISLNNENIRDKDFFLLPRILDYQPATTNTPFLVTHSNHRLIEDLQNIDTQP